MLKPLLFAIVAGVLTYELCTIGLADNGDFPRVAGRLSLCPEAGWDRDRFTYFVPEYVSKAACYWDSGVPTSAMIPARVARTLDRGAIFHIRYLGALYGVLLLGVFAWMLQRSAAYVFAGLIFLDIGYIAYCNSFFLEALSLVALLAVIGAAVRRNGFVFAVAALVLVTSKTQHAWLAVPLAAYAIYAFRPRVWAVAWGAVLLAAAIWMTVSTPVDYKATNLWNSVFVSLLPDDPGALASLHVGNEYAPYIGRNAYQFPDQATADRWVRDFYARAGYGSAVSYYLVHPAAAARRMWRSAAQLYNIRPVYLGVYARSGGEPLTYSWWSGLKSVVYLHAPWVAAGIFGASGILLWRSRHRPVLFLILAMSGIEFVVSCFADSTGDYRHHFLLHALSDVWLCFAAAYVASAGKKLWLPSS